MYGCLVVSLAILTLASAQNLPEVWSNGTVAGRKCESRPATRVYRIGNGVRAPKLDKKVEPLYPPEARRAHRHGTIALHGVIGENGRACDMRIVRSLGFDLGLEQAAVDAVDQWRFAPALKRSTPVPVWVDLEVTFHLRKR